MTSELWAMKSVSRQAAGAILVILALAGARIGISLDASSQQRPSQSGVPAAGSSQKGDASACEAPPLDLDVAVRELRSATERQGSSIRWL